MVKILSQGGRSLADMYQVVGSIAGIDQLETREVVLVHEMSAVLFSERFRTTIRRVNALGMLQNVFTDLEINNLPAAITRLLAIQVVSDDATRISHMACSVHDPANEADFPVWVWDGTSVVGRFEDFGTLTTFDILQPAASTFLPTFAGGQDQSPDQVQDFHATVRTTGFGAGTVDIRVFLFLGFTFTGGVSGYGARVPSW